MSRDKEEERDERIRNEVIVDAYTVDEQAISWCYYLERKMSFPFQARCIQERTISPLREDEEVRVVGMTDEVVSKGDVRPRGVDGPRIWCAVVTARSTQRGQRYPRSGRRLALLERRRRPIGLNTRLGALWLDLRCVLLG
jgi:hypothetical protein